MRVTTRGQYGVRAMVELARCYGQGPVSLARVAESQNLPQAYLEQLFRSLKEKGLVRSKRGPSGGYMLAREPKRISIGQIVRAVEGPIIPAPCASEDLENCDCEWVEECVVRPVWVKLRESIGSVLDSTTLADVRDGHV